MVKITGLLTAILVLALVVTPARSAPPPQDFPIQSILAGSLVAKRIPSAPANGQEINTPLGPIVVNFDDDAKQAEITLFNGSVRHIPYPPGFSTFLANDSDGVVSNVIDNDFTGLTWDSMCWQSAEWLTTQPLMAW